MFKYLMLLALLLSTNAYAADNAVILTPGSGVTMRTKDIGGGVQSPYNILGDTSGVAIYGTAGTANANVLSVQGISGGTAIPVSLTSTTITGTVAATQSGTWTVQPGNTPNTTPWLASISQGGNTAVVTTAGADAVSNSLVGAQTYARISCYNGTTWDRCTQVSAGTAGTPSTQVLTIQGITSGTVVPVSLTSTTITGTVAATQSGTWAVQTSDPCTSVNKTNLAISQNGTSSVQLIALSGSTTIYVCSLSLIAAGATTVALTTGTGSACVTGNAAVVGTTTSNIANSVSFAANGGLTLGNGAGTIAKGAASGELCMILGTSVFVSGNLTYVQQ